MYVQDSRGNYRVGNSLPAETLFSSEDAYKLLRYLGTEEQELYVVIVLDDKHAPISIHEMTKGLVNSNQVHPRETFKEAIRRNGTSIIVAHNHPSGSAEPSKADLSPPNELSRAVKFLASPSWTTSLSETAGLPPSEGNTPIFSTNRGLLMNHPSETYEDHLENFHRAWRRLKEVQKYKNKAISDFDLSMGYDWKFYAKASHMGLMRNHVHYQLTLLREHRKINTQMRLF